MVDSLLLSLSEKSALYLMSLARILPPSQIQYRRQNNTEILEQVRFGKWNIRNQFCSTPEINKWGMLYFSPQLNQHIIGILKKFEEELPSVSEKFLSDN